MFDGKAKVAIIAVAAVAVVVAAIAFAVVPRLGGYLEVAKLAQMSGEESGRFLAGLTEFEFGSDGSIVGYATSDELAKAAEENSWYGDEMLAALRESGGSIYCAFADGQGYTEYADAGAVSNWDHIIGFSQLRAVDKMPDVKEVANVVRSLGGEHMVVYNSGNNDSLQAVYTIGDGIVGLLSYDPASGADAAERYDGAFYSQDDVSRILMAIQVARLQGADGLASYLYSSGDRKYISIYDGAYILYYE